MILILNPALINLWWKLDFNRLISLMLLIKVAISVMRVFLYWYVKLVSLISKLRSSYGSLLNNYSAASKLVRGSIILENSENFNPPFYSSSYFLIISAISVSVTDLKSCILKLWIPLMISLQEITPKPWESKKRKTS